MERGSGGGEHVWEVEDAEADAEAEEEKEEEETEDEDEESAIRSISKAGKMWVIDVDSFATLEFVKVSLTASFLRFIVFAEEKVFTFFLADSDADSVSFTAEGLLSKASTRL